MQFTYLWASIKDVQATGEVFIPRKKTSSSSKLEFSSLFLWVILALLDPDPYSQCGAVRIRIQPTKMNAEPCGSGSATLVK
jgi:hypothetical protein